MRETKTELKICGLTSSADIVAAAVGADWLGVIVYPKSPRAVDMERATELLAEIPAGRGVLVDVDPEPELLAARASSGFAAFQIHCPLGTPVSRLREWSEAVGRENLWLAPRIPPGEPFPEAALEWANTILVDAFHPDSFGGTGKTGNWQQFAEWKQYYPAVRWILAGGLNPDNVLSAIRSSGADFVDVNSGVESAPGKKDPAKLKALFERLG